MDGERKSSVDTGIGYFDHVIKLLAFHGGFDVGINAEGDLVVDDRHTVEAVGRCFGEALAHALGDGRTISRFGSATVPFDDALVLVALDLSGRSYLSYDMQFTTDRLGGLSIDSIELFLRALTQEAGMTLHVKQLAGTNNHLVCEAMFKALGNAIRTAIAPAEN